jgi:hypothetical protein
MKNSITFNNSISKYRREKAANTRQHHTIITLKIAAGIVSPLSHLLRLQTSSPLLLVNDVDHARPSIVDASGQAISVEKLGLLGIFCGPGSLASLFPSKSTTTSQFNSAPRGLLQRPDRLVFPGLFSFCSPHQRHGFSVSIFTYIYYCERFRRIL